jgi:rSAM/selenodomain-associated transferase 1
MREPCVLTVMVKAPVCGSVKTRLGREIGAVAAVALYRTLTEGLLRQVSRDRRWRTVLAVTPPAAVAHRFACWRWVANDRIAQVRGGLGHRMRSILDGNGRHGIVVGSDIPFVKAANVAEAFMLLRRSGAVFGPAEDGGYWLVGLGPRARALRPFDKVRWSTANALTDTLSALGGGPVAFARTLFDVDTASDYRRLLRRRLAGTLR